MKIMHCCLAAFYIDDYGYQENVLPRAHKIQGHEVRIVASTESYVEGTRRCHLRPSKYTSRDGIDVVRLAYAQWLPHFVASKLRVYEGFWQELEEFKPEVIFLHDLQFLDVLVVRKYCRLNKVKVFVDSHTDYVNSARGWVSRNLLHRIIYRYCAKIADEIAVCFYPTLPARKDFMCRMYGLSAERMQLLPFGVDDTRGSPLLDAQRRAEIRAQLGIGLEDVVLITGGKIDARKRILELLQCFGLVAARVDMRIWLLVFGVPDDECVKEFETLVVQENVLRTGWLSPEDIRKHLQIADLAVFPGTHSVLWEEAVGLGVPCIFRRWSGVDHVDLDGNCIFLNSDSRQELVEVLTKLVLDPTRLLSMRECAVRKGRERFSYLNIAARAIQNTISFEI